MTESTTAEKVPGLTPRERVIRLLKGEKILPRPAFSGMGSITLAAVEQYGYKFAELHTDAQKMARAAASSYRLAGLESVVVPFDLCVEAEILGCVMNTYDHIDGILYPTIKEKVIHSEEDIEKLIVPQDAAGLGRLPAVTKALGILKEDVGAEAAIGSYLLGPFTLAGQILDLSDLLKLAFKKPQLIGGLLDKLTDLIINIANIYLRAGADFITVREMGACSDILSPRLFKSLVLPYLQKTAKGIEGLKVLHICGGTDPITEAFRESGFNNISVEKKNDLARTRSILGPDYILLGAVDGYNTLSSGTAADIQAEAEQQLAAGVDGLWPGCDIWPTAPVEHLRAFAEAPRKYKERG